MAKEQEDAVRIAHLTDTHVRDHLPGTSPVGVRRCRDALSLVERALTDARRRGAHVVVLTGDLVDVPPYLLTSDAPGDSDRTRWLSALERDYQSLKGHLDDAGLPYIAVPGNHDAYDVMASTFGAGPHERQIHGTRFISFWDRENDDHVPVRNGDERALFERVLKLRPRTQVHLQHFVVTPELNERWPHTYQDGDLLRAAMVQSGSVRLSISGHYHPGTELLIDDHTAFVTGSSLAEFPHCYRLYDVPDIGADSQEPVNMEIVPLITDRPPRRAIFVDLATLSAKMPARWVDLGHIQLDPVALSGLTRLVRSRDALLLFVDQQRDDTKAPPPQLYEAFVDVACELLAKVGLQVDAYYLSPEANLDGVARRLSGPTLQVIRHAQADLALDPHDCHHAQWVDAAAPGDAPRLTLRRLDGDDGDVG